MNHLLHLLAPTVLPLAPILILSVGAIVLMMIDAFQTEEEGLAIPTALLHFVAGAMALALWRRDIASAPFHGYFTFDKAALFLSMVVAVGGGFASLLAGGYLAEHKLERGEYYPLIAFSSAGAMMLVSASDFLMVFVGLETMSLGVYAMTGFRRTSPRSAEAALKYFLLGSFAAALLLFGAALLYVVTGHTDFAGIAAALHPTDVGVPTDPAALEVFTAQQSLVAKTSIFALLLILVSFAFKVGAVPFHMWVPDAYEGAPTPSTSYMAVAVKAAAFGALLRVLTTLFGDAAASSPTAGWPALLAWIAVATLVVGNLVALTQTSVKRMLAYSSIAHAGFILLGVIGAPREATGQGAYAAVLFYLLSYTVSNIGAFGALILAGSHGKEAVSYEDLAGLGKRHPTAAFALTFFLLSLAGVPPTAGFFAKFYIIRATLDAGYTALAVIAMVMSAVAAYYYLGVIVKMYMHEPAPGAPKAEPMKSGYIVAALLGAAFAVLQIGLTPDRWLALALSAASR